VTNPSPGDARLDPQARALLERIAAAGAPPLYTLPAPEARRAYRESRAALAAAPASVEEVRELSIPGPAGALRARLYRPRSGERSLPGVVYFHGGGFIYGDIDTHDVVCRGIAQGTPCAVVSVDYRLAPENKFPAAVEDAFAATAWVAANCTALGIDPARLAVAGDSAGGNLAAVTALTARDRGAPALAMQVLVYPTTDLAAESESVSRFGEGYLLTRESMRWVKRSYLRDERDAADWRASPLRARDLSGLPAAYIVTAGFDPLRDEGRAYAERLAQAGVSVTHESLEGQVHGFLVMGGALAAAGHAIQRIGQIMRMHFGIAPRIRP
jgi:acetyl esterase